MKQQSDEVLKFWYEELEPPQWFKSTPDLDAEIVRRFGPLLHQLHEVSVDTIQGTPRELLAAVIVLDQFSRTVHRGTARAFENDEKALALTRRLVDSGDDKKLSADERYFLYMPLMHSESLADQEHCLALYEAMGSENGVHWAKDHIGVIQRFGRFPHRNRVLGRANTPEEDAYLESANTYGQ